ncbi:MAG: hypothetical protein VB070_13515 [Clostridiaceae bacterium]|nr:hypothetical protein [Clostridiaceae bacterium]
MNRPKSASSKKGSALSVVMLVLAVIMIITTVIASMYSVNLQQAKLQEDRMKAYYLALSGVEVGYSALMTDTDPDDANVVYYYKKYAAELNNAISQSLTLDDGTVDLRLSRTTIDGKVWLVIEAEGHLNNSTVTNTTAMRFRDDNPAIVVRTQ